MAVIMMSCVHTVFLYIGMDDIHCSTSVVTFKNGSDAASVNIPLVNDNIPECDETFTAYIITPGDGFRLGQRPSTSITISDEGKGDVPVLLFGAACLNCYTYIAYCSLGHSNYAYICH